VQRFLDDNQDAIDVICSLASHYPFLSPDLTQICS
jgi:hypothetical protein